MRPAQLLALLGCLVLLLGCEAVGKALTQGGPEFKPGAGATTGSGASFVERLARKVERLESEQMKLERDQANLERERDQLVQGISALSEELKAMRVGVVVPPPARTPPAAPPSPSPQKAPAEKTEVAAVPSKPVAVPRTPIDAEASKKALLEGIKFSRQGDFQQAEAKFLRAIELNPTNGKAHYALGFVYSERDEIDRALEAFKKAVKVDPQDTKAHYGLGYVYDEKGMLDEAIAEFKKAIELNPNEARAHYNLGVIYEKKGMKEEAERELAIYNSLTSR